MTPPRPEPFAGLADSSSVSHSDGPLSDERLAVDRLRSGDISGLEVLVQRHQLQATRAAYLVVRDRQLAEDIVCDAFLRCCERIQHFDASRPFAPWFLRMVVNDALKAAERRARHVSLDTSLGGLTFADLLPDRVAGPDVVAERASRRWSSKGGGSWRLRSPSVRRSTKAGQLQEEWRVLSTPISMCTAKDLSGFSS